MHVYINAALILGNLHNDGAEHRKKYVDELRKTCNRERPKAAGVISAKMKKDFKNLVSCL